MHTQKDFPDYENPPVVEVVCGILFKPLEAFLAPHSGLLWEKYKSEYPNCREVAPLTPVIESFGEVPEIGLRIADVPPLPRIWFIHENDNGIVQVQRDRFLHNWKKVRPDDQYPHYHKVIEMFKKHFSQFLSFIDENKLGQIEPWQYEMTYVNHITQGAGWNEVNEVSGVFPDFAFRLNDKRFLPGPEGINWRTTFVLPDEAGRLHVMIRNGRSRENKLPIIIMELTARGLGTDKSIEGMWAWFDMAREWIVRGFIDLTSEQIQKKIWGRK